MIISLRTTSYTAATFVALLLGFLLLLGSRQYRSHKEYENIIEQNEKIIFQFATIREHINESLLENRHQQLNNITQEIENLNANISQILQKPIIPNEYRLSFAGQVDFAGIILLLRNIGAGDQSQANIRQLNQEIRILGERLMLFDRVIADHMKRKLVGFQNFVIGLLAIILFFIIYILLFWHRQIAVPLIDLLRQTKEVTAGKRVGITLRKKTGEVAELAGSFQNILLKQSRTSSEFAHYNRLLELVHTVSETIWKAQTRDGVFNEACRAILTNSDYILVWVGIPDENQQIIPVTADASTTMSRHECDECMAALLNAADENREKYDAAHKALEKKAPEILRDVLQGLPKGPFKNTPFAAHQTDCIALPLLYDNQVFGVMNIYSISSLRYSDEEVELLKGMSREIVFALFALEAKECNKTLARLQSARKKIFENNPDLILVLKEDSSIFEANPAAKEKLNPSAGEITGTSIYDFFSPVSPGQAPFLKALKEGRETVTMELTSQGKNYRVNISHLKNQSDENDMYLFIARDLSEQMTHKKETIKASKLAAMGELSVGVANEINNLTNGLINYTQILSEEIEDSSNKDGVSRGLLNNVIKEGERISQIVQQLLFFNANQRLGQESVKIDKIIEDSFALVKQQFRCDAIDVTIKFPPTVPSVQANAPEMQHVFLNILNNARYALNQRYPNQHPQKRLEIKGEVVTKEGRPLLRISCTDFGVGIHPNIINKVFELFFTTKPAGIGTGLGLSISRSLVEDNKGTLTLESIIDDHTTISLELPVAS